MKQQNFLFVDIVSSVFLLLLLIGNFMGILYITDGSMPFSILGSMFMVVCYFFIIQQLKKNKEVMIRKNFLHASSILWVFFLFLSFISFYLMSHFINIEYNCKEDIKNEATEKLDFANGLSDQYNSAAIPAIEIFEVGLKDNLEAYAISNSSIIYRRLTQAPYNINRESLIGLNRSGVQGVLDANLAPIKSSINASIIIINKSVLSSNKKYQDVFDNWKRLVLSDTYSKLNDHVLKNITMVNAKIEGLPIKQKPIKVDEEFQKKLSEKLPLNNPEELNIIYPPNYLIPLFLIFVTHLFILIPFFTEKIRVTDSIFERIALLLKKIARLFGGERPTLVDPLEAENVREI